MLQKNLCKARVSRASNWMPRLRVWSREIVERLERRQVAETLEACPIVVVNEAAKEGIAVGMGCKQPVSDAPFGLLADCFDDPPIEAFDQSVGLRSIGSGQSVIDLVFGADEIEGMAS